MPEYTIAELLARLPRAGRLEWIGLRPARRGPLDVVQVVYADTGQGLRGDHSADTSGGTPTSATRVDAQYKSSHPTLQ